MTSLNGPVRQPAPTIDDYWVALYRRAGLIILVALVSAVVCGVVSRMMTPQYEAKAVFYVPQDAHASVGIDVGARLPSGLQDHARAFAEILQHVDAWRVVQSRIPQKPINRFGRDVDVVVSRESTIEVYVRDRDPELAAAIANGMIDYFNEFNRDILVGDLEHSIRSIGHELDLKDEEIAEAIQAQGEYMEEHDISSLATRGAGLEQTRLSLDESLRAAKLSQETIDDRIGSLQKQLEEEGESYAAGEIVVQSSTLTAFEQSLASLEVQLTGSRAELAGEHPQVKALERQVAEAEAMIAAERARLVRSKEKPESLHAQLRRQLAGLYADRAAADTQISGLEEAMIRTDQQIGEMPQLVTEMALQDEVLANLRDQRRYMDSIRNTMTTKVLDLRETAVVIEAAVPPTTPAYPIIPLNIGVAGMLGLIVGIMYALVLEHGKERRRTKKLKNLEVERWAESLVTTSGARGHERFGVSIRWRRRLARTPAAVGVSAGAGGLRGSSSKREAGAGLQEAACPAIGDPAPDHVRRNHRIGRGDGYAADQLHRLHQDPPLLILDADFRSR